MSHTSMTVRMMFLSLLSDLTNLVLVALRHHVQCCVRGPPCPVPVETGSRADPLVTRYHHQQWQINSRRHDSLYPGAASILLLLFLPLCEQDCSAPSALCPGFLALERKTYLPQLQLGLKETKMYYMKLCCVSVCSAPASAYTMYISVWLHLLFIQTGCTAFRDAS